MLAHCHSSLHWSQFYFSFQSDQVKNGFRTKLHCQTFGCSPSLQRSDWTNGDGCLNHATSQPDNYFLQHAKGKIYTRNADYDILDNRCIVNNRQLKVLYERRL